MKNLTIILFFINLIIFILPLINCSLMLPLTTIYLKEIENMSLYNESITNNIIRNIFDSLIFIDIKIGTPIQEIKIQININSDDFFIAKIDADFDRNYPKRSGNFYFNQSLSSTFAYQTGKEDLIYYSHPHMSNYVQDIFIFKSINHKNELQILNKFNFLLAYQVRESQQGVIGLKGFASIPRRVDFLTSLKNYNVTNNYIWYLKYDNLTNGNLHIGKYPHEEEYIQKNCGSDCVFKSKYFGKIYSNITEKSWLYYWGLKFKNIMFQFKNESQTILIDCEKCKMAQLEPNFGLIKGSKKFEDIIVETLFKKYINQKKCFKETLNVDKNYEENSYNYYYCYNSIKNKLREEFNNIVFEHKEYITNFTLDFNDLFFEENDFIFFKMIFDDYYNFIFGGPFISKYLFVFNSDTKEIGYYSKNIVNEEEKDSTNIYLIIKIVGIMVLGGILIIIGILIGKKLFEQKRKVRMNELEDNFEI